MGRIRLLDDTVINKIAAGEVVERPASVVKELVENALDAGATDVRVELMDGGRKLISITDNGCGMDRDDAVNCLTRHATSKIRSADDLFSVTSMGFRGEAMPSIASVSRMTIVTRPRESASGTRVTVNGGESPNIAAETAPIGTRVTIEDIFFNVPARLKFLRAPTAEYAQALEVMHAFVLAWPSVSFTLTHNGREQLRVAAVDRENERHIGERALRERARAVLGSVDVDTLLYVREAGAHGALEALTSPPGGDHGTSRHLHFFVNGRWTKDKVLRYAINRAYHTHLPQGRYPASVLMFSCDPALVDVNVHPAKTELRFQYHNDVQSFVAESLRKSIRAAAWATPEMPVASDSPAFATTAPMSPIGGATPIERFPGVVTHASSRDAYTPTPRPFAMPSRPMSGGSSGIAFAPIPSLSTPQTAAGAASIINFSELTYVGTFARCYLIFQRDDALLVADQHAFHERVIYERLRRDESLLRQSQALLLPEAVDVAPSEASIIEEHLPLLRSLGFDLLVPGAQTVEVRKIPSLLRRRDIPTLIQELASGLRAGDGADASAQLSTRLLATIACHSAVRAGDDLTREEISLLLREAADVDFYHNCPHGRRVFRWWSREDVSRWFDRP